MSEYRDRAKKAFVDTVTARLLAYVPRGRAEAEARDACDEFLKAWGPEPRTPQPKTTKKVTKKRSSK